MFGVLGSGPVNGVLLGAAISIVLLLRQAARPRVVELARVPGTAYFADRVRHPENEPIPGVLVIRCESALLYFNVRVRPRAPARAVERAPGSGAADRLFPRRGAENRSRRRRAAGRPAHRHFARAASSSGSPTRMARCVTRCDGLGSSGSTGRSRPARPSTASSRSGRRAHQWWDNHRKDLATDETERYEKELNKLQVELSHLQQWVKEKGLRVIIIFEGRDGAGKGGTIRAITERLSPRVFKVVGVARALPTAKRARSTCSATCSTSRPRAKS